MNRLLHAMLGFGIGWLVCLAEYFFTATAWGGHFTILMIPIAAAVVSALSVFVAALLGLLLLLPMIKNFWAGVSYKVAFLALIPLAILVFSKPLGLRTIDSVSGYSLMSPWVSIPCYVFIVFPFVNLPRKKRRISPSESTLL